VAAERDVNAVALPKVTASTRQLHPREVVRASADGALVAAGHQLSDDGTVLCLDWHGTHGEGRSVVAGAAPVDAAARSTRSSAAMGVGNGGMPLIVSPRQDDGAPLCWRGSALLPVSPERRQQA